MLNFWQRQLEQQSENKAVSIVTRCLAVAVSLRPPSAYTVELASLIATVDEPTESA